MIYGGKLVAEVPGDGRETLSDGKEPLEGGRDTLEGGKPAKDAPTAGGKGSANDVP